MADAGIEFPLSGRSSGARATKRRADGWIDTKGKECLAEVFSPAGCDEVPDQGLFLQRSEVLDDWCRVRVEWLLIEGERVRRFAFTHWLYSGRELRAMLLAAGFATVSLYGHLDGSPYGPGAPRLVAVARKGGG